LYTNNIEKLSGLCKTFDWVQSAGWT